MKVIGICGSPRKGQTTEFALQRVLSEIRLSDTAIETEFISLAEQQVKPCTACGYCYKHFSCSIEDDAFNAIAEKLKDPRVKAIICASPVYMGGMTAQTKAFLDRSVMFRRNNFHFKNMIGAGIAVGGSRNGGQELVLQELQAAMLIHDMIIVGDGKPSAHFGGAGWSRAEGGMEHDEIALETYKNLAQRLVEMIHLTTDK